jgi:hypothetical protein
VQAVRNHAAVAITHARIPDAPPAGALRGLNRALAAAPPIRELACPFTRAASGGRQHSAEIAPRWPATTPQKENATETKPARPSGSLTPR